MDSKDFPKRRIFINKGDRRYQIFSFHQDPDGTIYCGSPDFAAAKWLSYELTDEGPEIRTAEAIGEGKISLHGTGMTAVRANDDPKGHSLVIKGNHLLDREKKLPGARHLLTAFLKEPHYLPENSPVFNRDSDYSMQASEDLQPFVLVFFAVPRQGVSINFQFNLHEEEMNNIPNDFLGGHIFSLRHHDVFWFAYRTKYMNKWPKYAHFSYHDGFTIPIFIGTGQQEIRLEFRQPTYSLVGKDLTIQCVRPYED